MIHLLHAAALLSLCIGPIFDLIMSVFFDKLTE